MTKYIFKKRLGVLAADGICRPFDMNTTGYTRADTICVVLLQRFKDAKRVYARNIASTSNNDGYKPEGPPFPSKSSQVKLMKDFYRKLKVDPLSVNFVEAHSTGTRGGDFVEVNAIDEIYCNNRTAPLAIGSTKSNIGHAEAASGMASIAKIILAFENGKIAPNINLATPREDISALKEGRIRVVTEVEDFEGSVIAMNSFGMGGDNVHILMERNNKERSDHFIPTKELPYLVLWSGRTEEALKVIFDQVTSAPLDREFIALLHGSQRLTNSFNTFRGYGIFTNDIENENPICIKNNVNIFNTFKHPIVFVYSGMGCQWPEMGKDLMEIPTFRKAIDKCHEVLMKKNIDLKNLITSSDKNIFESILNSYVAIPAIQIALTDILKTVNIKPDYIIGHSMGELACAYADGCMTLEEVVLTAHARAIVCIESKLIDGAMAAIGMQNEELKKIIPDDIDVACHNSSESSTISGPSESVKKFVGELQEKKVFAKEVACARIPFHSRYIKHLEVLFKQMIDQIIKVPTKRSEKWLSSCYPEDQWSESESQFSSSTYHAKNFMNPVLFEEVLAMLPENVLTIEIAPHKLLNPVLKRAMKNGEHVGLAIRGNKNGREVLLTELGNIFSKGVDMDVANLYPKVQFPVSRGTPMIAPLIKWNHVQNHFVPYFDPCNVSEHRYEPINLSDKYYEYVIDHVVGGISVIPLATWLKLVVDTYCGMFSIDIQKMKLVIENIEVFRMVPIGERQNIYVTVSTHRASGSFEIIRNQTIILQGKIKQVNDIHMTDFPMKQNESALMLDQSDFYKVIKIRGYDYRGIFRSIQSIRDDGQYGKIKWNDNWAVFIDNMLQFSICYNLTRNFNALTVPTKIRKILIDAQAHMKVIDQTEDGLIEVTATPILNIINAGGIQIHGLEGKDMNQRKPTSKPILETFEFLPHVNLTKKTRLDTAKSLAQITVDFNLMYNYKVIEIEDCDGKSPFSLEIFHGFNEIPMVSSEIIFLSSNDGVKIENVKVECNDISFYQNCDLLIISELEKIKSNYDVYRNVLSENGFIILREYHAIFNQEYRDLLIIANFEMENEVVSMLQFKRKKIEIPKNIIKISRIHWDWLEPLKRSIGNDPTLVYSQYETFSGIMGLYNCVRLEDHLLKHFPNIHCVFIDDPNAPEFDVNNPFYSSQLKLGNRYNVLKDGKWGTYRHKVLSIEPEEKPHSGFCYIDCLIRGSPSSLTWIEGPTNLDMFKNSVKIHYAALNFRDVVMAFGKIDNEDLHKRYEHHYSDYGLDFSGCLKNGKRVMGFGIGGSLATFTSITKDTIIWDVPNHWSMEEAATMPLVYFTVYYSFFHMTNIEKGKSILIHAGAGGVGLAAIQVALHYGLDVHTTVGSEEKRAYLLKIFPSLKSENIGNSRDESFEKMVMFNTEGKGVNYVLNSLSGDLLQASIRCLSEAGIFLELGKADIINKTNIHMGHLGKRIQFRAVKFEEQTTGTDPIYEVI